MRKHYVNANAAIGSPHQCAVESDAGPEGIAPELIEDCRDYLLLVAERRLNEDLRRKIGASDIVQETFLRAQQNIAQFRGTSRRELLAWLRRILLNHLADENRRYRETQKRRLPRERFMHWGDASRSIPMELTAGEQSPSSTAIANEEAAALARAMGRLPDDYGRVIQLRTWQRLPFAEVGARMNRSTDAARKLWTRAIERLELELDWSDE